MFDSNGFHIPFLTFNIEIAIRNLYRGVVQFLVSLFVFNYYYFINLIFFKIKD